MFEVQAASLCKLSENDVCDDDRSMRVVSPTTCKVNTWSRTHPRSKIWLDKRLLFIASENPSNMTSEPTTQVALGRNEQGALYIHISTSPWSGESKVLRQRVLGLQLCVIFFHPSISVVCCFRLF